MANQRSVKMPVFNYASRTFAFKILAQVLNRSVSSLSSFIGEYLDPVVKSDHCGQYLDDVGIAANNAMDPIRKNQSVFQCIRQTRLKLTIRRCHFGVGQVQFLGRTISTEKNQPKLASFTTFLPNSDSPNQKRPQSAT